MSVVKPAASLLFVPFLTFFFRVDVAKPALSGAVRVTARLVGWKLAAKWSASATMSERCILKLSLGGNRSLLECFRSCNRL